MKEYKLAYLLLFRKDLNEIVRYIAEVLRNPQAARNLIDEVESAIQKRLYIPEAVAPYPSVKWRALPYYPIYVREYIVLYVVIDNTMEVRRILYSRRNLAEMF
jgi:toxin-antitoxin system, toxin component, relE family